MMGMRAKKICIAMLLIVGGIMAVFLAHRKVAEKITEEEYQRFLDGEVPAMKESGKTYFLEDLFWEDVSDVETFLSDIDSDGVKELHIRNGFYYILEEKEGKLTIIYEGTSYDHPVEAMSGILFYRDEGAPYHEVYRFTKFQKDGTMVEEPTYECYDRNEDGEIGVEDVYLKDGVEQDRTAWEKETEIYRAIKNERGL
jgi:hypothetical protein